MPDEDAGYTCATESELGRACTDEPDCVRGGCVDGVCALRSNGDVCLADAACEAGLVCHEHVDGRCGRPRELGESCVRDVQCQDDLLCTGGSLGADASCRSGGAG